MGYRAAIAEVFHLRGLDLSSSPELAALVKHFQVGVCASCLKLPPWNLNFMLCTLRLPPYEPLELASLWHVRILTLFMTAFCFGQVHQRGAGSQL